MSTTHRWLTTASVTLALAACAAAPNPLEGYEPVTPVAGPAPLAAGATEYPAARVERGRYLVNLLGCGSCHTDGALIGEPDAARVLAGSRVGIATSDPTRVSHPGVVYPKNLTPDPATGIGDWTLVQIVTMLQSGVDNHGSQSLPVMPWLNYSRLQAEDAEAIAMYLKSLPAVPHRVPANVPPGRRATEPFVHFGVYRSQQ